MQVCLTRVTQLHAAAAARPPWSQPATPLILNYNFTTHRSRGPNCLQSRRILLEMQGGVSGFTSVLISRLSPWEKRRG